MRSLLCPLLETPNLRCRGDSPPAILSARRPANPATPYIIAATHLVIPVPHFVIGTKACPGLRSGMRPPIALHPGSPPAKRAEL